MKIAILCGPGIGFPNGTAPTARVRAYSRGLLEQGDEVQVLCLGWSESPDTGVLNSEVRGTDCGVEFEYTCGTTVRPASFIKRRWLAIRGPIAAAWSLLGWKKHGPAQVVVLYADALATALLFWAIAKAIGAVYVLEKSERPFLKVTGGLGHEVYIAIYSRLVFRLFHAIFVISDYLRSYFEQRVSPRTKILKVPVLVDVNEFAALQGPQAGSGRRVVYCGTLNEEKDGVLTLMKAFSYLCEDFPDLRLVLVGDHYIRSSVPKFRCHAEEMGIGGRVDFVGLVPRTSIPQHLSSASVLALARPASMQAEAGFPTKVGEYLASGRPVVVTNTGELDRYLEDGRSAFFAPPGNAAAFAECLRRVLLHPQDAIDVGLKGREVAKNHFDYRENAGPIHSFLAQLTSAVDRRGAQFLRDCGSQRSGYSL